MSRFSKAYITKTIEILLKGGDYRSAVIHKINVEFLDFTVMFFKKILNAKMLDKSIDFSWYKKNFINNKSLSSEEVAINSGLNKKTISNIYGSATKEIIIKVANNNLEAMLELLADLEAIENEWSLSLKIEYKDISVNLSLKESLLVINVLATKKLAINGGAWSSIGKSIEKPLMLELCKRCKVNTNYIKAENFKKDKSKKIDREVDFKLLSYDNKKEYRIEVKLMGKGNPESADVIFARDTDIIIADTLSIQNKNQIISSGKKYLELKNNINSVKNFKEILLELNIPCNCD